MRPSTALILAAGMGNRLGEMGVDCPKGFLRVNTESLVERSLSLLASVGIERVVLGVGHLAERFAALKHPRLQLHSIRNPHYDRSGSLKTLQLCASAIHDDILLLESDLLYSRQALELLLEDSRPDTILGSTWVRNSNDQVYVCTDAQNHVSAISKDKSLKPEAICELVGISKLSLKTLRLLAEFTDTQLDAGKCHYEEALAVISQQQQPIGVTVGSNLVWTEIDTVEDLRFAQKVVWPLLQQESQPRTQESL